MRYISLFGGIGGFDLGIQRAFHREETRGRGQEKSIPKQGSRGSSGQSNKRQRATCVFYNDIDKYAVSVYNKNFGTKYKPTDIRMVKARDIPDFDLLCGGFPCQSFSQAGKRKGFEDTRGTLFFEVARILKTKRPNYLLLENVKGLLNHDKGRTFKIILETLEELGYETQWMVLNSKFHGVPQNRERVFIIGHLRGQRRPEILPFRKNGGSHKKAHGKIATCPTLDTSQSHSRFALGLYKQIGIRRLTPIECERLQGFPDGWTEKGLMFDEKAKVYKDTVLSNTQRYKMLGNAVTTNVISAIIKQWQ